MERQQQLISYFQYHDDCAPSAELGKHIKMANSPFQFLRGSAPLMYKDIAEDTLSIPNELASLSLTTVMGDCHTSNFGFISEEGSHSETMVFCPNDFDDACFGPAVWDLVRFLVSLPLARLEAKQVQAHSDCEKLLAKPLVSEAQVSSAQRAFLNAYIDACEQSVMGLNNSQSALGDFKKQHVLHKRWVKANERKVGGEAFLLKSTLAKEVDLTLWQFKQNPEKFEALSEPLYESIYAHFRPYVDDDILDIVKRKNAGTGSNNLDRYYLLVGPSIEHNAALTHIVEVKQQRLAAPLHYFKEASVNNQLSPAHLTVNCQRKMQRRPDLILDDTLWQNKHWLIRSRHHARVGIDSVHFMLGKRAALKGGAEQYAASCGEALALAHMRGDRRSIFFQEEVVDVLPEQLESLIEAANQYVEQVITDWKMFKRLVQP